MYAFARASTNSAAAAFCHTPNLPIQDKAAKYGLEAAIASALKTHGDLSEATQENIEADASLATGAPP